MNGFNDDFFEMRENVANALANEGLQDLHDNLKNAIVIEFAAKLEDYNISNDTLLTSDSTEYEKMLLETISFVLKNNKNVNFQAFRTYDVVEDDYSEQSDAEMRM